MLLCGTSHCVVRGMEGCINADLYSVVLLLLLIARSKLVPDFALTIHFLHLIVTSLYAHSLPTYWFWWALQACSATLMTFLGMWACQWRELRPINFGGGGGLSRSARQGDGAAEAQGDEGAGYGRGRGRGRGRDGAGEYEMVEMAEGEGNV